jgi:hypothetical protein
VCRAKLGQFADGLRLAARATELAPKSGDAHFHRAVVETLSGKPHDAEKSLSAALANGFSRTVARDDEDLAPLRNVPAVQDLLRQP